MHTYGSENLDPHTLGFIFTILAIIIFIGLFSYIFTSIAWMNMAKNQGIENPWLAWIPIARYYTLGELLSDRVGGNGAIKFLIIYIVACFAGVIPIVGPIISVGVGIFSLIAMYWLFEKYSEKATLHTVLSIVLSITIIGMIYYPIVTFNIRNNPARR